VADIDVVKKGSSSWVWILAVLAAVVLIWLLWSSIGSEATTGRTGPTSRYEAVITAPLASVGMQHA